MTNERAAKTFDCVQAMREARDTVSGEIEGMSYDQLIRWLRIHRYEDAALQRLAEKAAPRADAAGDASTST